jgi:hypothetical protein
MTNGVRKLKRSSKPTGISGGRRTNTVHNSFSTSNRQCPRGPLQTRVKEIHLSATYPRTSESRVELARHLKSKNRLFEFFSKAYFQQSKELQYDDDEAHIARAAFGNCTLLLGARFRSGCLCLGPLTKNTIQHQFVC